MFNAKGEKLLKKQIRIRVSDTRHHQLEYLSERLGIPMAQICRKAIYKEIDKQLKDYRKEFVFDD